jgi:hypothetical protein
VKELEILVWKAYELTVVASLDRQKHYSFLLPEDKAAGGKLNLATAFSCWLRRESLLRRQVMQWPL